MSEGCVHFASSSEGCTCAVEGIEVVHCSSPIVGDVDNVEAYVGSVEETKCYKLLYASFHRCELARTRDSDKICKRDSRHSAENFSFSGFRPKSFRLCLSLLGLGLG